MNPEMANPPTPSVVRTRWLLIGLGAVVIVVGLLVPNLAEKASAPQPIPDRPAELRSEGPDMGAMLLRLVGGTVFVLALCVLTLWLCRRWLGATELGAKRSGRFEVLESLPLGPRCRIHLVRAGDRHLLAGMDAAGLKVLLPVEDQEPGVRDQESGVRDQESGVNI